MTYCLEHVVVNRGAKKALDDLSLTLDRGQVYGLLGPNGAGKSTFLSTLAGEFDPAEGEITLDEVALPVQQAQELARMRALMPQQTSLDFNLTARQVIGIGAYAFGGTQTPWIAGLLEQAAHWAGVTDWLDMPMTQRSGGERQRIAFARILLQALAGEHLTGKAWLLLDEPTANQDPLQQQMVMACCRRLAHDRGFGVMAAVHDLTLAAQWCDSLVLLRSGKLVAAGGRDDVLTQNTLRATIGEALNVHIQRTPVPAVVVF